MDGENKGLVITVNFYRMNKTLLDIKAKIDERTYNALQQTKQTITQRIGELKKDVENLGLKVGRDKLIKASVQRSQELYEYVSKQLKCDWDEWHKVKGHKREYEALINAKIKTYEALLK